MTLPARLRSAAPVAVLLALTLAGCGGSAPSPSTSPAGPGPAAPSASAASTPAPLTIDITLADGKVSPNAEKIDASVGQQVVLTVASDTKDEIHAHTGGDGYELEVTAGKVTTGGFPLTTPGSFEIESHGTGKIIAILNVR